jgi:hypothetical protein
MRILVFIIVAILAWLAVGTAEEYFGEPPNPKLWTVVVAENKERDWLANQWQADLCLALETVDPNLCDALPDPKLPLAKK